jgi:hypothetical protein
MWYQSWSSWSYCIESSSLCIVTCLGVSEVVDFVTLSFYISFLALFLLLSCGTRCRACLGIRWHSPHFDVSTIIQLRCRYAVTVSCGGAQIFHCFRERCHFPSQSPQIANQPPDFCCFIGLVLETCSRRRIIGLECESSCGFFWALRLRRWRRWACGLSRPVRLSSQVFLSFQNFGNRGLQDAVFGSYACLQLTSGRVTRVPDGRRTVVGRAFTSSDDCSNHSALVLKYGMVKCKLCAPA